MTKLDPERRAFIKGAIAGTTLLLSGGLSVELLKRVFSNNQLNQTELLQDITQRGMSLNELIANSPFPPGTQWLHLVVQPNYKAALPYLELSNGSNKGIVYPIKDWNNLGLPMYIDISFEKPENEERWIIYGDSNTEGMCENKDSFPSQLERLLHAQGHKKVRVINAGVSSTGPLEAVLRHIHIGRLLSPNKVFFAFNLGNDLMELHPLIKKYSLIASHNGYVELGPVIVDEDNNPFRGKPKEALNINLIEKIEPIHFEEDQGFTPSQIKITEEFESLRKTLCDLMEREFQYGSASQGGLQRYIFAKRPDLLKEFQQRLKYCFLRLSRNTGNAKVGIILIPSPYEIECPDIQGKVREIDFFYKRLGINATGQESIIRDIFRSSAIKYLGITKADIIDPLEAIRGRPKTLLTQDWHYSPEGNSIIAKEIAKDTLGD